MNALKKFRSNKRKRSNFAIVPRATAPRRTIRYPPNLFPTRSVATLRYSTTVSFDAASATPVLQVMSANGCYDPDITGTGHQPRGFDQWMAIYNHYCVSASRCTVIPYSQAAPDVVIAITLAPDSASLANDINDFNEMPFTTFVSNPSIFFGGKKAQTPWYSMRRQFRTPNLIAKDSLCGSASANPSDQQYFHINVATVANTNAPAVALNILVEYRVTFFEPKIPDQS